MKLAAILAITAFAVAPAHADDKAAAEAAFLRAKALAGEGKWVEACPLFEASYRSDPQLGALLNVADCNEQIGKTATAWAEFHEAVELAHKHTDQREAYATQRADALVGRLAKLAIHAHPPLPPGLVVRLDKTDITVFVDTELPVDPGTHELVATAPGFDAWKTTVTIAATATTTTTDLPPLAKPGEALPHRPPVLVEHPARPIVYDDTDRRQRRSLAWKIVIPSAVVVAGGLAVGFYARTQKKDAQNGACDAGNVCTDSGVQALDRAQSSARIADVLLGLGAAGAITGLVLWATAPSPVERTVSLLPIVTPDAVGAVLRGSF